MPNGAYGLYTLGLAYEKQQLFDQANDCFYRALELNPTLWIAFEKLCKNGQKTYPNTIFSESSFNRHSEQSHQRHSDLLPAQLPLGSSLKKTPGPVERREIELSDELIMASSQMPPPDL